MEFKNNNTTKLKIIFLFEFLSIKQVYLPISEGIYDIILLPI